jgi:hypothetical protein
MAFTVDLKVFFKLATAAVIEIVKQLFFFVKIQHQIIFSIHIYFRVRVMYSYRILLKTLDL